MVDRIALFVDKAAIENEQRFQMVVCHGCSMGSLGGLFFLNILSAVEAAACAQRTYGYTLQSGVVGPVEAGLKIQRRYSGTLHCMHILSGPGQAISNKGFPWIAADNHFVPFPRGRVS